MTYFINRNIEKNEFKLAYETDYFIDKSELISKINTIINKKDRFLCITRPRRFGKTINAMMLESYYSKNANFKDLFDNLKISDSESYEKHLNKHNVVYLQLNELPDVSSNVTYDDFINRYKNLLFEDIEELWPNIKFDENSALSDVFNKISTETGEGFIFIIDEWDFIFNNNLFSKDERINFLYFLKDLLKDRPYVELCYMTGVIPIAKYSTGSALNMFQEYTFLNDNIFHKYFGFTTEEVENICKKQNNVTFQELKEWYDGYKIQNIDIYNPRSVISALTRGICQSYWTNTGPMDEIIYHINKNIEEVKNDVIQMVSNIPVEIRLKGYGTEQLTLETRNQILSAMTVYGFLTYHDETLEIPNKELMIKFDDALEDKSMNEVSKLVLRSDEMLKATIRQDIDKMCEIIQEAHDLNIPIIKYNDENSLACVISLVYLSARSKYKIVREIPAGIGFADFIFYPKDKSKPAFIIELKKNSTSEEALKQIFDKRYDLALKDYTGLKLAIGISYDSNLKKHSISIKTFF